MYEVEKNLFEDYYSRVYQKWRIEKEKAGKDIVGEEYQRMRREYYQSLGLTIGESFDVLGSGLNTDTVAMVGDKIKIIEEDKGSYLDSTFLCRAVSDAAKFFLYCTNKNIDTPYFIISSTTKMENYDEVLQQDLSILKPELVEIFKQKFIYLPLCEHGRVNRKVYFKNEKNHFELSDNLLTNQHLTIQKILSH